MHWHNMDVLSVTMDTDVDKNFAGYDPDLFQSLDSAAPAGSEVDLNENNLDGDKSVPSRDITDDTKSFNHSVEDLMKFAEILYKCTLCTSLPSILTSKDSFLSHVNVQHLGSDCTHSQKCSVCRLHFGTKEDLRSHLDLAHAASDIDLSSDSESSYKSEEQTSTEDSCFVRNQNAHDTVEPSFSRCETGQNFTVSHKATESYDKLSVKEPEKRDLLDKSSLQREVKTIVSEASNSQDDRNTSPISHTNISRLQQLTDQILSQDTVRNTGTPMLPMSLTPSFTPEFGKYTKLVREGGNIVYFCQVCNWKSQAKATFSVHCSTSQHTNKVKNADQNPTSYGGDDKRMEMPIPIIPTKPCEKKYQEPVSWSHRGTLSFLADTAGYLTNRKQPKMEHGRNDEFTKINELDVKPFTTKELLMSDLIRTIDRSAEFNTCANYKLHSDLIKERTGDSAEKVNDREIDKSEFKHLVGKDAKSFRKFKYNKRKGSTPISVRNQEENSDRWSDNTDSDSNSSLQENNSISVGPSQMSQRIDCKKRLLETITSPVSDGKHFRKFLENDDNKDSRRNDMKQDSNAENRTHSIEKISGNLDKSGNRWLSVWENQGQIDPVFLHHLNVLSNVNSQSERNNSLEKVKIKKEAPESSMFKCPSCDFSCNEFSVYQHHVDMEHENEMITDAAVDGGKSLPGESAKMQKIKDTLKGLLCTSPKGNVGRELLLQKVSLILQMPEVMQWGPACNKAVRWEFPNSLAQRKGKYKKTYFFGVSLVEQTQEQEEFSDGENVTYQPLRDMSLDLEKLLEHLPTIVYWTGDIQAGVVRDEVLDLLHEKIEEPDVQHWGVQCNRAMRLLFPDIQMKRKGKFKTTVFFGIDFMKNLEKRSFIPNKRGRPKKGFDYENFLPPERTGEAILTERRLQTVEENILHKQMSHACSWMESMQNYNPAPIQWQQPEKEFPKNPQFGNVTPAVNQSANLQFDPKCFTDSNIQLKSNPIFDVTPHTINHLPSISDHNQENGESLSSSTFVQTEKDRFGNNNSPISVHHMEGSSEYSLLSKHKNKGREFSSSPPTRRWDLECENDGDDEDDTCSDSDQEIKRKKREENDKNIEI